MRRRWATPVIIAIFLSGCVGPASPPAEVPQPASGGDTSAEAASAPPTTDAAGLQGEPIGNTSLDVDWAGKVPTRVFACVTAPACQGFEATEADDSWETNLTGPLSGVDLTLTWTPSSPLTNELFIAVRCYISSEKRCAGWTGTSASGVSPLRVVEPANSSSVGAMLVVYVVPVESLPVGFNADAATDQPFRLTGTIALRALAPTTNSP